MLVFFDPLFPMNTMSQCKVKTQRTLDFKALAVLTVVVAVLGGGIYGRLDGFQVKCHARDLLRLADQAESKGQAGKAIEHLELYLNLCDTAMTTPPLALASFSKKRP